MTKTVSGVAIFVVCCIVLGFLVAAFDSQDEKDAVDLASAAALQAGCHLEHDNIVSDIQRYREDHQIGWAESGKDVAAGLARNCADPGS